MENETPYMVEQVIKYSDGTEKVIKYRGVIVNGELVPTEIEEDGEVPSVEEAIVEDALAGEEAAPVEEAPVE